MSEKSTQEDFNDSEVVVGLVGPVGVDFALITDLLQSRLTAYRYTTVVVRVSSMIIPQFAQVPSYNSEYERVRNLMDAGDQTRQSTGDNSILAKGVAAYIASQREHREELRPRTAYIVHSLKHPDEVYRLQGIYPHGFYLIGVYSSTTRRRQYLVDRKGMSDEQARTLIERDEGGSTQSGQHTSETFHLADFFVNADEETGSITASVDRFIRLLFGHPFITPVFEEFAMFMAFAASLRSADLSRQVGAVVARDEEILAVGANDCPRFGGGLYWPRREADGSVDDHPRGRDFVRGVDANKAQQARMIDQICKAAREAGAVADTDLLQRVLSDSPITDLIEFGRVVHAELEALLSCARRAVSTAGATIFCTTFPCHNCAKHIIAAGVQRVVYVEPYPKSKAFELHDDAVTPDPAVTEMVRFEPFVGVSPRRFFDLFSMNLSFGWRLRRKDTPGRPVAWEREAAKLRVQMLPMSYLALESIAAEEINAIRRSAANEASHG